MCLSIISNGLASHGSSSLAGSECPMIFLTTSPVARFRNLLIEQCRCTTDAVQRHDGSAAGGGHRRGKEVESRRIPARRPSERRRVTGTIVLRCWCSSSGCSSPLCRQHNVFARDHSCRDTLVNLARTLAPFDVFYQVRSPRPARSRNRVRQHPFIAVSVRRFPGQWGWYHCVGYELVDVLF